MAFCKEIHWKKMELEIKNEQKGAILVGDGSELFSFYSSLQSPKEILGIFCSEYFVLPDGLIRLGGVDDVPANLDKYKQIRRVYCSTSRIENELAKRIHNGCKARGVKFCAVLPVVNSLDGKLVQMHVGDKMLLTPQSEPLSYLYNRLIKRFFDLVLVVLFMLVIFPFVYLWKAAVIKRKKGGSSFVTHRCCGPNGRVFKLISFKGETNSVARVFNVVKGDMSLVGPAPYVLSEEEEVGNLPKRLERNGVKPGLTGWAQLKDQGDEGRLDADIWYAENWSLWLDVRILVRSIFK